MRWVFAVIAVTLLLDCHQKQPRYSDTQMTKLHAADPGMKDECLKIIQRGGSEALTKPQEECYKFDPPRRWKGIWYGAFETSEFCPQSTRNCPHEKPGMIWLEVGPSVHARLPHGNGKTLASRSEVDFVGRKTSY